MRQRTRRQSIAVLLLLPITLFACGHDQDQATLRIIEPSPGRYEDLPGPLPDPTTTTKPTTTIAAARPAVVHASRSETTRAPVTTTALVPETVEAAPTDVPIPQVGCDPNSKKTRAEMIHCWDPLVRTHPWPNVTVVYDVMGCESQGKADAYNPQPVYMTIRGVRYEKHAQGLMQVLGGSYDPTANIDQAWEMSDHGTDFDPWVSCL